MCIRDSPSLAPSRVPDTAHLAPPHAQEENPDQAKPASKKKAPAKKAKKAASSEEEASDGAEDDE